MNVEALTPYEQYIQLNVNGARQYLAQAHALLAQRPAMVAPQDQIRQALGAARNAAEHLYDIGQIDEPTEAVREALAAAEVIMTVVRRLDFPKPGAVDVRARAAEQLLEVDMTLGALERALKVGPALVTA